jgi:hypothetical protein
MGTSKTPDVLTTLVVVFNIEANSTTLMPMTILTFAHERKNP